MDESLELSTTAHGTGIRGARTLRNNSPRDDNETHEYESLPVAKESGPGCSVPSQVPAAAIVTGVSEVAEAAFPVSAASSDNNKEGPDPLAASTVESWSHAELGAYVSSLGMRELLPNLSVLHADGRMIPVLMEENMMQFAVDHKVKRTALVMAMRVAFSGGAKMALDWPASRVRAWLVSDGGRSEKEAKRAFKNLVHGAFLASMAAEQLMDVLKITSHEEAEQLASAIASNAELHELADAVGLALEMQAKGSGFAAAANGAWGDDEGGSDGGVSEVAGVAGSNRRDSAVEISRSAFRGSLESQFGDEAVQMPGSPMRRQNKETAPERGGRLIGVMRYSDEPEGNDDEGLTSSFLAQQFDGENPLTTNQHTKGSSPSRVASASLSLALPPSDFYRTGNPAFPLENSSASTADDNINAHAVLLPLAQYQHAAEKEAEEIGIFAKIRWNRSDVLGRGAFGAVYRAFDMSTGKFIAVKELVQVDTDELREQVEEIRLLKDLVHPNVVAYLGATMRENVNDWGAREPVLCIATELMAGGSIASVLEQYGPLEEPVVQRYTCDILDGLSYLHSQKLVHRDIKPANCLVGVDGTVKLADFGESKKLSASMTGLDENRTMKGTPYFMAPEVLLEDGHGRRADIWSVGATVIAMATGHPPWRENGYRQIVQLVLFLGRNPTAVPQVPATCSGPLEKFLSLCFQRDPRKRLLAAELRKDAFLVMPPEELVAEGGGGQDGSNSGKNTNEKSLPHKDSEGSATIKRIISTGERMIEDRQLGRG